MRRLLILLVALGVLASGYVLWLRLGAFPADRQVELAISNAGVRHFAYNRNWGFDALLREYMAAGATSMIIRETTLYELMLYGDMGYNPDWPMKLAILDGPGLIERGILAGGPLVPGLTPRIDACYVITRDNPEMGRWIYRQVRLRLGADRAELAIDEPGLTVVAATAACGALVYMPLGIFPGDLEVAERYGLRPLIHLTRLPRQHLGSVEAVLGLLPAAPARILFFGDDLPGYPDLVGPLAAEMARRGDTLVIDTNRPRGLKDLSAALGGRAIKAYRPFVGERWSEWVTAVKDRSVRLLLITPYIIRDDLEADRDIAHHVSDLREFGAAIAGLGFSLGEATPVTPFAPPVWAVVLAALGALAGGVYCAIAFFQSDRWALPLFGFGLAATLGVAAWQPAWGLQGLALGASIAFAALPLLLALEWRVTALHPLIAAVLVAAGAAAVATLGGLLAQGLLPDSPYILQLDLFRGVKLQLVLPSVVVGVYLLRRPGRALIQDAVRLAGATVRLPHLALALAVAAAAVVLIIRSGNIPVIAVFGLELRLRDFLEEVLVARPRAKEFLLGYPALMLAVYLLWKGERRWVLPFAVAGAIAPASVLNSFAHLHTPTALTLLRVTNGLWLGLLAGLLLILLCERLVLRRDRL